jgi:serine/threonine-protein kinase
MAWDSEDIAHAVAEEVAEPAADDDEVDPLVGTMLKGKWRIDKKLGDGAFGTVYRVEDIAGGWMEALKILRVDKLTGAEGESMKKRFLREAQIMKRLGKESKHIVGLSTYEEDFEAGLVYLVMEYVEGQALADLVTESGPLSVERTVDIALQVCDALIGYETRKHHDDDGHVGE